MTGTQFQTQTEPEHLAERSHRSANEPTKVNEPTRLGRFLAWFGIGLGTLEVLAPRVLTTALGLRGLEGTIRVFGAREIASGALILRGQPRAGLWARTGGDILDTALLMDALRQSHRRKGFAKAALLSVLMIGVLDAVASVNASDSGKRV